MSRGVDRRGPDASPGRSGGNAEEISPGKRTLVEQVPGPAVQLGATGAAPTPTPAVHEAAARGMATPSSPLPHGSTIQHLFGHHDVSNVQAHTGPEAAASAGAMGAQAYATGNHVVLGAGTDLHTVAHEAAHVVQQRGGVQLRGGVGEAGDPYERHADQVADAVVQGKSAEGLLDRHAGGASSGTAGVQSMAVQRFDSYEHAKLGDETDKAIGGSGAAVSAEESTRRSSDKSTIGGGGRFDAGQRSLSMNLRARNPANSLPTADGKSSPVPLSYGEMMTLSGDLYSSVDNMKRAPADEVVKLRDLVHEQGLNPAAKNFDVEFEAATAWRRAGIYKPGTGTKEGAKGEYWEVGGPSYLDLAQGNNAHFSAATGSTAVAAGPEGNAASDNHQAWLTDHSRAIALAKKAREAKKQLGLISSGAPATAPAPTDKTPAKPGAKDAHKAPMAPAAAAPPAPAPAATTGGIDYAALENDAYVYNAGGDHYLTDAFAAGHLFNKKALEPVTDGVLDAAAFEKLIDDMTVFADKEHPLVPHRLVRGKVASGLSVFRTDAKLRHNVGAKLVHDFLNENGASVKSKDGKFSWKTMGDTRMDATTQDVASRAVLASRNYIRALLNDSDADLTKAESADDAWDYTPNVDASAFAVQCEPFLRYQLTQGAMLWGLMQNAVKAQDAMDKEKKDEAHTAKEAKHDSGGDWGLQPNGSHFTRRMVVAEGPVVAK